MAVGRLEICPNLTGENVYARIIIEERGYSVENNTSLVHLEISVGRRNLGHSTYGNGTLYGNVDGQPYTQSISYTTEVDGTREILFFAKDFTILHQNDGSKTITVTVNFDWTRTLNESYNYTLTKIPRASTISCDTFTLGSEGTIKIKSASSEFAHRITYAYGNDNYYKEGQVGEKTEPGTESISWTPPKEFAEAVPSSTLGAGTLFCDTYSGDTKIGTTAIVFYCNLPDGIKPKITSFSVDIDNSANETIAGWGLCVAGYSKVKLTAKADGNYGSTIDSFDISGAYSTTQKGASLSYTGNTLTSGNKTFTVNARDTRGRSSVSSSKSLYVHPYSKPTVSSFTVARCSDDATKMEINANWAFAPVGGNNKISATISYKKPKENTWTVCEEEIVNTNSNNWNIRLSVTFEETSSYNFKIIVRDSVGNSVPYEAFVSTVTVLLDFRAGGRGLGIGKMAESDSMEVDLPTIFIGDVFIRNEGTDMSLKEYIQDIIRTTNTT